MAKRKRLKAYGHGSKKKKIKKRVKKALIIVPLVFFIILTFLFFFGIKISFVIDDELKPILEPRHANFFATNDEVVNVEFSFTNKNFRQCDTFCEFRLYDSRSDSIIRSENQTFGHNEKVTKSFNLGPAGKGSGQLMYSLDVECNNVKSFVCLTDEVKKYESALVTINYDLTGEEEEAKDTVKSILNTLVSETNDTLLVMEQNDILAGMIPVDITEKEDMVAENEYFEELVLESLEPVNTALSLWTDESYLSIDYSQIRGIIRDVVEVKNRLFGMSENILGVSGLREDNIGLFKSIDDLKPQMSSIVRFYENESNQANFDRLKVIEQISEDTMETFSVLDEKKRHSENVVNDDIKGSIEEFIGVIDDFEEIGLQGKLLEVYKKALISIKYNTTLNVSDSPVCDTIRELKNEVTASDDYSVDLRNESYNWSLGLSELDTVLNDTEKILEILAITKAKVFVQISDLEEKGSISALLDAMLNLREQYFSISVSDFQWMVTVQEGNVTRNETLIIPIEDLYRLARLSSSDVDGYLEHYCLDPSFDRVLALKDFKNLIDTNFSVLEELRVRTEIPEFEQGLSLELKDNLPQCCSFGKCKACGVDKTAYPVLFIHGHEIKNNNNPDVTMNEFSRLQKLMQKDGYVNVGELDLFEKQTEEMRGVWGFGGNPITIRASYYLIRDYGFGMIGVTAQKSERIENYALRLNEIVDLVKFKTGADRIDIIALSMGGLVLREYLGLFGTDDVRRITTINSPNHGVVDRVRKFCSVIGASKECEDMSEGSVFLNRLNSRPVPEGLNVIRSIGCEMGETTGDGIVTNQSAYLEGANNYVIEGECTDTFGTSLHGQALDPELHPETYELILEILTSE